MRNKGRPPALVAKVDEIDGTEFTLRGTPVEVTMRDGIVTCQGREYSCDTPEWWKRDGVYRLSPNSAPQVSGPTGRPAAVVLTSAGGGGTYVTISGEVIREPVIRDMETGLELTHKGRIYGCAHGAWPLPGNYPMRYLRAEPVRETGVDASQWWAETKERMYSPEMCEAYRAAALLARAAGREIHPDYWRGVPEEYRV